MKEKIPEISVIIDDKTYTTNHQEEVKIARETLDENMIEQAGLYAWYAVLEPMIKELVDEKDLELDTLQAQLYEKYKNEFITAGDKYTDKAIDSKIKQDESYMKTVLEFNRLVKYHGIFKAIVKAFEHRKEMLINLGAKLRKESDMDLRIKAEEERLKEEM